MFSPIGLRHRWLVLISGDFIVSSVAAYLAFALVGVNLFSSVHCQEALVVLGIQYLVTMYFQDLYRFDEPRSPEWVSASVLSASAKSVVMVGLVVLAVPVFAFGRWFSIFYFVISAPMLLLWRVAANQQIATFFRIGVMGLGFTEYGPLLAEEVKRHAHVGYRFAGFASIHEGGWREVGPALRSAAVQNGAAASIADLANGHGANVLVLLEDVTSNAAVRELTRCRARGLEVLDLESFYERMLGKLPISFLRDSWLLHAPGFVRSGQHWRVKRIIDVAAAILIGLATLPLSLLTAIAIKLDSPGPVFYRQERVGLDGKVFRVYKFRSMRHRSEAERGPIWADKGDARITRVGHIIRRHRIDELPQLLNVLQGSMSIVGPRPQHPEWVEKLGREVPLYEWRHFLRPGLTGWAQVCWSYGATVDDHREMLAYDLYYLKNWTLTLDLQIMLQTAKVAIFGRGAR